MWLTIPHVIWSGNIWCNVFFLNVYQIVDSCWASRARCSPGTEFFPGSLIEYYHAVANRSRYRGAVLTRSNSVNLYFFGRRPVATCALICGTFAVELSRFFALLRNSVLHGSVAMPLVR